MRRRRRGRAWHRHVRRPRELWRTSKVPARAPTTRKTVTYRLHRDSFLDSNTQATCFCIAVVLRVRSLSLSHALAVHDASADNGPSTLRYANAKLHETNYRDPKTVLSSVSRAVVQYTVCAMGANNLAVCNPREEQSNAIWSSDPDGIEGW